MSSDGGSFGYLSVHVGTVWAVRCSTYTDITPILSIDAGSSTSVSFTTAGRKADLAAVGFARELAKQAQAFADEIERMHADRTETGNDKAAGDYVA